MNNRELKDLLYEQVARISKALSSPKRLELLEMLAQGEKSVETLTAELSIDVKLTSAHLKALKTACLVQTRREGKYIFYRLSDDGVAQLGIALRTAAECHLDEMRQAMGQLVAAPKLLTPMTGTELLAQVRRGDVVVIDVRPRSEYDTAHLPLAISMPLAELESRIQELPKDRHIVAYCRGPFCMLSDEAVQRLVAHGYRAQKTMDGVSEWRAAGVVIVSTLASASASVIAGAAI